MGVAVSASHIAAPSSSLSSPAPVWGPSHRRQLSINCSNVSPSHILLFFTNYSSMGPLHGVQSFRNRLPQRGSFTRGAVLQEQTAPVWVPHGVTSPASKPAPVWASLSMGPQVLPGVCSSMGSPWAHSLRQASTCSSVLHGLQVDICSTMDLHGL